MTALPSELLDAVAHGAHHDPHSILGSHETADGWVIRARRPLAREVVVELEDGSTVELSHTRSGIWEGLHAAAPGAYRVRASYDGSADHIADDPYRHVPSVGELDLHLISEGRHEELWRVLGAHVRELDGSTGTAFTVWAPDARAVRVIGDFNGWDGTGSALRSMGGSGVWELFVPEVGIGSPGRVPGSRRPIPWPASPRHRPRRHPS